MPDEEQNKGEKGNRAQGLLVFWILNLMLNLTSIDMGVMLQRGINTLHKLVEQFVPTLLVLLNV